MSKRVKGIFADIVLVSVALIWIVGVDHVPCLKMVGFPLLLLATVLWSNWSPRAEKIFDWIDKNL